MKSGTNSVLSTRVAGYRAEYFIDIYLYNKWLHNFNIMYYFIILYCLNLEIIVTRLLFLSEILDELITETPTLPTFITQLVYESVVEIYAEVIHF